MALFLRVRVCVAYAPRPIRAILQPVFPKTVPESLLAAAFSVLLDMARLELLAASAAFSFGMQPINLLLSYTGTADNFTGAVEFIPAALLGLYLSQMRHVRELGCEGGSRR